MAFKNDERAFPCIHLDIFYCSIQFGKKDENVTKSSITIFNVKTKDENAEKTYHELNVTKNSITIFNMKTKDENAEKTFS